MPLQQADHNIELSWKFAIFYNPSLVSHPSAQTPCRISERLGCWN